MKVRIRFMGSSNMDDQPKMRARWRLDVASGDQFIEVEAEDFFALHQAVDEPRTLLLDVRQTPRVQS